MPVSPFFRHAMCASLLAIATGCGGAGGLSQEDMAQYALRRPKADEAAEAPVPNPSKRAATPATNAATPAAQPNAAAGSNQPASLPTAPITSDVPAISTGGQPQSINPVDSSASPAQVSDTISPPSAPLAPTERRQRTLDNLTKISAALERYREERGRYPLFATFSQTGQPLLSWRVELLPYLGYQSLYDKFNKSEPWNSIKNQPLLSQIPSVYQSPERYDTRTNYVFPVGSSCAFFGNRAKVPRRWEDGMTNVAVLLEIDDASAVAWSAPEDHEVDLRTPKLGLGNLREDGFFMAWGGGQVARVGPTTSGADIKAMFTVDGGEPFSAASISLLATAEFEGATPSHAAKPAITNGGARPTEIVPTVVTSSASASPAGNSRDDLLNRARFAFTSQQEAAGVSLAYVSFLCDQLRAADAYHWIPALRRPAAFVRYGIAVDYSGANHDEVADLIDSKQGWNRKQSTFNRVVGELGEEVVQRFEQTTMVAPDAVAPDTTQLQTKSRLPGLQSNVVSPGVECLGAGDVSTITRVADERNIDVLMLFTVQDRAVTRGTNVNKYVSLKCFDVANRRSLYESSTISYARREKRRTTDLLYKDPVTLTLVAVERLIQERLQPKPIPPDLRAKHAAARAKQLARNGRLNRLRSASEVKLYHQLELLSMQQALSAYKSLIGEEAGLTILAGDPAKRRAALADFMPRIQLPDPDGRRVSDDD